MPCAYGSGEAKTREALMGHKHRDDPSVGLLLSWAFVLVFSVFATVALAETAPPQATPTAVTR